MARCPLSVRIYSCSLLTLLSPTHWTVFPFLTSLFSSLSPIVFLHRVQRLALPLPLQYLLWGQTDSFSRAISFCTKLIPPPKKTQNKTMNQNPIRAAFKGTDAWSCCHDFLISITMVPALTPLPRLRPAPKYFRRGIAGMLPMSLLPVVELYSPIPIPLMPSAVLLVDRGPLAV